ncbi:MAG TPA: L-lactate dehydrogenase [Candidatus Eubacterium faecale]|uniref:L-lactate dehydrogenase n=1 Tax=Candidatus Eubacterium faecale TaxID=2838568 RepID=A0A9D2MII9_9FIRM|nr:L-lactate dehydrogenase [Candidatus Eubacterium faecale]
MHENPRAQDSKKVAIVGVGMVGMSFAYAMLNQNICDELCLIDINKERAEGEAMDLSHGLPFAPSSMKIYSGDYTDCTDMDMIVICAGVPQLEGETRRDLLQKNYKVFKTIVKPIVENGFNGVFLVASNPVDVMTKAVLDLSGFPPERVIGSGTSLDTARLRYMIGDYFKVNPRNIHAYVMGEHGDSEFVAWSSAMISVLPIKELDSHTDQIMNELDEIAVNVRDSAYKIIKAKKATYYGIGMVLARLTRAILNDENSIFTISAYLNGEYSESGFYIGVPALINRNGVRKILEIPLDESEKKRFKDSAKVIKEMLDEIGR